MPRSRGNENCISRGDFTGFPVDFHEAAAGEDEVNFLAGPMVMALRAAFGGKRSFCEALIFNGCVGVVENASDCGSVSGGERSLFCNLIDCHLGV